MLLINLLVVNRHIAIGLACGDSEGNLKLSGRRAQVGFYCRGSCNKFALSIGNKPKTTCRYHHCMEGDVVGLGINFHTRTMLVTKNGVSTGGRCSLYLLSVSKTFADHGADEDMTRNHASEVELAREIIPNSSAWMCWSTIQGPC